MSNFTNFHTGFCEMRGAVCAGGIRETIRDWELCHVLRCNPARSPALSAGGIEEANEKRKEFYKTILEQRYEKILLKSYNELISK